MYIRVTVCMIQEAEESSKWPGILCGLDRLQDPLPNTDHIGSQSPVTSGPPLSLHPMLIVQYIQSDFCLAGCLNSKDSMGLTSKEQQEQGHQELHILHLLLTRNTQGEGRQPPLAYLSTLVSSCFLLGPWPQIPPWSPYLSLLSAPAPLQTELNLQKPHRDPNKQSDE